MLRCRTLMIGTVKELANTFKNLGALTTFPMGGEVPKEMNVTSQLKSIYDKSVPYGLVAYFKAVDTQQETDDNSAPSAINIQLETAHVFIDK